MVTTSGSWLLNVSADTGSAQGSLVIPAGGAVVTMPGSTCTVTVGASTIGPLPFDIPNQRVVASNTGHCELHAYRHRARLPRRGHWHGNNVGHTAVRVGLADQRDAVTIDR